MDEFAAPTGQNLLAHWQPSARRGFGLLSIPDSAEPVIVEWEEYEDPGRDDLAPEHLGRFSHGATRLLVRERFEDVVTTERGEFRGRYRHTSDHVCCSEIARVLARGEGIPLSRIERGAYRGLWRGDVYDEEIRTIRACEAAFAPAADSPGGGYDEGLEVYQERACRLLVNLPRATLTLFRWRSRVFDPEAL